MRIKTGTYTGNGTGQAISGLGFAPDAVFIKGASTEVMYLQMVGMTAGTSISCDGAQTTSTTAVLSRDSDGFTLGTSLAVNTVTATYYWVAIKDSGDGDVKFGTYTGDAVDGRAVTGLGFTPDFVMVMGNAAGDNLYLKTTAMGADNSARFAGTATLQPQAIKALSSGQFTVGNDGGANGSGLPYLYIAFKATTDVVETGSYTGDGTDPRTITNVGAFSPDWVIVKKASSEGVHKPDALAGDSTLYASGTAATTDRIQALNADGFAVGANAEVNTATGSPTYYWINLQDVTPAAAAAATSTPPASISGGVSIGGSMNL